MSQFMDEPPPQPVKQKFVLMPVRRKIQLSEVLKSLIKFNVVFFYPKESIISLVLLYICNNITTDSVTAKITALILLALYGNSAFWTTIYFAAI